ncbi:MAG TPA: hypothetical protein VN957_23110 [Chthoniobacterales bacterium]|nr:hypothetical protein [Chthoniobacterales bacterium]
MRNSPSFQLAVDHGHFSIELHTWRNAESATFIYDKAGQGLLQQFTAGCGTNGISFTPT